MFPALVALFILFFNYVFSDNLSREAALASSSIAVKLNYLIEKDRIFDNPITRYGMGGFLIAMPLLFLSMIMTVMSDRILAKVRYYYPSNIFLIGKEIERQRKREEQRDKIVWGVAIALIINILAGVAVWVFTR
jgi:hypothetical protein